MQLALFAMYESDGFNDIALITLNQRWLFVPEGSLNHGLTLVDFMPC